MTSERWRPTSELPPYKCRVLICRRAALKKRPYIVTAWWEPEKDKITDDLGTQMPKNFAGLYGWMEPPAVITERVVG